MNNDAENCLSSRPFFDVIVSYVQFQNDSVVTSIHRLTS